VWEIGDGSSVLKVAHADHELARARMAREADALAAIGPPAVPALVGRGVLADGRAWVTMERIAGTTLGELIAGGVRVSHAVELAIAMLEALAPIHAAGWVHRDFKPDNLVRRADSSICILDLGLARRLPRDPDDPTRSGVQVGSLEYMAPEQMLDASAVDERADIYAFGCVLYELCAGRPPFVGDATALERAHAALRPPPLGALAKVTPELEQLCHDCLAKQPARRPASARELAAQLRLVGNTQESRKRQHSRSMVSEGKQPVVLVWAELPKVDRALLGTLAARKIVVVSHRGRRVLGGVVGADHADPAGAALAAARDLAAAGARVALHLEALYVASRGTAVTLTGAAVERPESWLPDAEWTGVVLTRALATVTQAPTRAFDQSVAKPSGGATETSDDRRGHGFVLLGEAGQATELFGRDAQLADVSADAAAAFAGAGPALAVAIGDHGVGKTAFAAALVQRLGELGVRVHAGAIPPPGSGRPGASALTGLIGTRSGPIVRAVGDALRAAAREQPTAIVLDDAHLAEHELLDALEYATLGGEPLPLWILVLAPPRFDQRRPGFGARAERHHRIELRPLDEDAAIALTAALLRPAEYPPVRALRQIAAIARGNPMHLATLAREIHDRGAIRTRPNGEHFLDTSALDALPPIALGPWLAARELASLGVEVVALARVCAVLGGEIHRDELAAVVEAVERSGGATTTIDVDVGLAELVAAGVLVAIPGGHAFRQTLLEDGVYATTNEDERRALHAAALAYWRGKPAGEPAVAERVARHAEAVGDRRTAAAAFATLGEHQHAAHQTLDADQSWSGALRTLAADDPARARALLGRARSRYRLQRVRDALADVDAGLAIAERAGDQRLEIELLIEKATALDWSDDYPGSAAAAARARERIAAAPDLATDVELAEARSLWRAQRFAEAAPRLRAVVAAAHAAGRVETELLATLMLTTLLADVGDLDAAGPAFDELIAMCEAQGDRLHLGAAYANRSWLWSARGEVERCAEDLRLVIQIAREIGQAALERIATYNLAESLLWHGAHDEALRLAQRSVTLQRAHGEGAAHFDQLLVARILAARGARGELAAILDQLAGAELADHERAVVGVLRCVADGAPPAAWAEALAAARDLAIDNQLELAHLARAAGALPADRAAELRAIAAAHPIWRRRAEL